MSMLEVMIAIWKRKTEACGCASEVVMTNISNADCPGRPSQTDFGGGGSLPGAGWNGSDQWSRA